MDELPALWRSAFNAKDWPALVALYSREILFYGSTPDLLVGTAAVLDYFRALPDDISVEPFAQPVIVPLAPDVATMAMDVRFRLAKELLPFRMTWTIVRIAGDWKIAAHHASRKSGSVLG
jgi:ketosteroid isomerase-like protein